MTNLNPKWENGACKQALNIGVCEHFKKEAIEKAVEWMSTHSK